MKDSNVARTKGSIARRRRSASGSVIPFRALRSRLFIAGLSHSLAYCIPVSLHSKSCHLVKLLPYLLKAPTRDFVTRIVLQDYHLFNNQALKNTIVDKRFKILIIGTERRLSAKSRIRVGAGLQSAGWRNTHLLCQHIQHPASSAAPV